MTPLTRTTGPQLTLSHPVVWPLPNLYSRCSTFIVGKKFSSLPLLAMVKLSCCPLCSSSKNTRWQLKLDKKKQMLMKGTSFFSFNSYLSNQGVRPLFSQGFELLTKIFNSVHGWLTILCSLKIPQEWYNDGAPPPLSPLFHSWFTKISINTCQAASK